MTYKSQDIQDHLELMFGRSERRMKTGEHVEVWRRGECFSKRFGSGLSVWDERETELLRKLNIRNVDCVQRLAEASLTRETPAGGLSAGLRTYHAWQTLEQWRGLPVRREPGTRVANVFRDCAIWFMTVRQSLYALQQIHEQSCLHLDIKADNLCIPALALPSLGAFKAPYQGAFRLDFARLSLIDFAFSLWEEREPLQGILGMGVNNDVPYQSAQLRDVIVRSQALEGVTPRARQWRDLYESLDWRADLYGLGFMLKAFLDDIGEGDPGWTAARRRAADHLVFDLMAYDDRWQKRGEHAPEELPHAGLIEEIDERLAASDLQSSLSEGSEGWRVDFEAPFVAEDDTPSTRTAVALRVRPGAAPTYSPTPISAPTPLAAAATATSSLVPPPLPGQTVAQQPQAMGTAPAIVLSGGHMPAAAPAFGAPSPAARGVFRDSSTLTKWTTSFFLAHALGSAFLVVWFIGLLWADSYGRRLDIPFEFLISPLFIVPSLALVAGLLRLIWTYRANHNARCLGALGMVFTPGWSVAWRFIPIANLWKPYQVMKEIWFASASPSSWSSNGSAPGLLRWWWFLFLFWWQIIGFVFNLLRSDTRLMVPLIIWCIVGIPLSLISITIIRRIHAMQLAHVCGYPPAPVESSRRSYAILFAIMSVLAAAMLFASFEPNAEGMFERAENLKSAGKYQEAAKAYERAYEGGYGETAGLSAFALGELYANDRLPGEPETEDGEGAALRWYRIAASLGYAATLERLNKAALGGDEAARQGLLNAANNGNEAAKKKLKEFYEQYLGRSKDEGARKRMRDLALKKSWSEAFDVGDYRITQVCADEEITGYLTEVSNNACLNLRIFTAELALYAHKSEEVVKYARQALKSEDLSDGHRVIMNYLIWLEDPFESAVELIKAINNYEDKKRFRWNWEACQPDEKDCSLNGALDKYSSYIRRQAKCFLDFTRSERPSKSVLRGCLYPTETGNEE